jgi:hypothetical protein
METHIDPPLQNPIESPTTKPIFYDGASSWRVSFSWDICNYEWQLASLGEHRARS